MIVIQDNHAPRLARAAPDVVLSSVCHELEAGADLIVTVAQNSIKDGAISGAKHVASLPGEAPNADTHVLDQSIHRGTTEQVNNTINTSAIADAPYAAYLELGTTRMAERPYMSPAAARSHEAIVQSIVQRLRDER